MNNPKTISGQQVVRMRIQDIRPGHIIAEGVVMAVRSYRLVSQYYSIETPHNLVRVDENETVQVYAQLDEEATIAFLEQVRGQLRQA